MRKFLSITTAFIIGLLGFCASAYDKDYEVEALASNSEVTFYFQDWTDDWDLEDPWQYLYIYCPTANNGDGAELEPSSFSMPFEYKGDAKIFVSISDFDFAETHSLVVSVMDYDSIEEFNESGKGTIENNDGTWSIELNDNANGAEITVAIIDGTGGGATDLELDFSISGKEGDNIEDAYKLVKATYFDLDAGGEVNIPFTGSYIEYRVPVGKTVDLKPEAGYMLNVTSYQTGCVAISNPQEADGTWQVYVVENPDNSYAMINIEVAKAPAFVTFDFISNASTIYGNPQDYVTVSDASVVFGSDENNRISIPEEGLEFTLAPASNYEIKSVDIYNGDQIVSDLTSFDSSMTEADGAYTFKLSAKAAGLVFIVDVEEKAAKGPSKVTFYFQDGTEDYSIDEPWKYVSIFNPGADKTLAPTSASMEFEYTGEANLFISPDDLDYAVVVSFEGYTNDEFMTDGLGEIENNDGTYSLTLYDNADGLEIYVKVYPAGEVPGDISKVDLSFNISAADGEDIAEAYKYLTISYSDFVAESGRFEDIPVEVKSSYVEVEIPVGKTVEITPANGYKLNVSTFNTGTAKVSNPQEADGSWQVYIPEQPTEPAAYISIEVSKSQPSVLLNFTSSSENIFGNPQDQVTVTSTPAITLSDTSNKVVIPADGLEFTIVAKEGYEIASLKIAYNDTEISLEDLDDYDSEGEYVEGGYKFSLAPAAGGLSFTFDIADQLPGVDVDFIFTAMNFETPAYEAVTVTVDMMNTVPVDSEEYTYTIKSERADFIFAPKEGYSIQLTCTDASGDDYGDIIAIENQPGAYQISLPAETGETIPEGLTIKIDVTMDEDLGVGSIEFIDDTTAVYNLQGIRIYSKDLAPGIYIVNGKKVLVRK